VASVLGDSETAALLAAQQDSLDGGSDRGEAGAVRDTSLLELNTLLVKLPLWGVREDSRTAKLFKAMHSEMLFPALDQVETATHPHLSLRPQPATWEVHLRILPAAAEVHVSHRMWMSAVAMQLPATPKLRFCWQLALRFDMTMATCLGGRVSLLDLSMTVEDRKVHDAVEKHLEPLTTPILKYRRVWKRPRVSPLESQPLTLT
jgi:hypothetical protein